MEAKGKFQISLESAFYLLKHFDGITIEELQELEKAGKLIDDIKKQFSVIGSKFHSAHISGYRQLLELINTTKSPTSLQSGTQSDSFLKVILAPDCVPARI